MGLQLLGLTRFLDANRKSTSFENAIGKPQAPFSHFFMKLVLAAPASGLPSELTALVAHWSAMHFFMNDVFAAPASALPSLPTALLSQVSCAIAVPAAKAAITVARTKRLSIFLSLPPLN